MYEPVEPNVAFPALEEDVLEWWRTRDIYAKTLAHRDGAPEYVFYEGPPFANAPPGVHSVLPRALKDVFTRYRSMKGYFVPRKAGWDCHGLPAELEIEKRLGFTEKKQIIEYGVEKFNELCRRSVTEYVSNYVKFSERIAFWLDYDNAYETMSNEYIESVWWSLAELHRKGLLFEADRVAPYCPRCETPLSDHELGQEGVYQEVDDPGVTLLFPFDGPVQAGGLDLTGAGLAVWTTTPWTLISNLAAAVHPEVTYALVETGGRRAVVAGELVGPVFGEQSPEGGPRVLGTFPGRELVGLRYRPVFPYARRALEAAGGETARAAAEHAWRVVGAEFVNVEDGTGVVHLAAAFGADDLEACRTAGIPTFNPVDASGRFGTAVEAFAGRFVKDADPDIVEHLRAEGVLLRSEPYRHTYPHCWRCGTPLLYYALTSWYVRTTAHRDRLIEVNRDVNWIPEHIREGRYGKWLEHNVDWSLSRYRFWGTPLPIWRCGRGHDTAVESVAQLSRHAGRDLAGLDLHRPHVDDVVFACPECGDEARRVPDLIDVWYDSGAMPFAQYGYPHRNMELFKRRFPADFIAEGLDQTRGWFYSLMAESVLLFDSSAYRTVICHGLIVDAEGKKMSKSRGIVDPWDIFARFGSDALRFYYLSAGNPADNRRLSDEALEGVLRGPFLTLWNVYRLFVLYARIDGFHPGSAPHVTPGLRPPLDRWALAELHQVITEVDEALDAYDSLAASRAIATFIDDLSNWYVRRSRRRFWREAGNDEERADKAAAYWTLWTCLVELSRLLAPFTPFLSEALYRNLVLSVNPDATESVHLTDFPRPDVSLIDPMLAAGMAAARELVSLGRSARTDARVKVRQPMAGAVLLVPPDLEEAVVAVAELVADELNVHQISFAEEAGELVRISLRPNYRTAGPDFGPRVRDLAAALEALGDAGETADRLEAGEPVEVEVDGEWVEVQPEHVEIRREPAEGTAFAYEAPFGVSLDLQITPELRREGMAREFVHQVQNLRRDLELEVSDRIRMSVTGPAELLEALEEYEDYVSEEVLAVALEVGASDPGPAAKVLAVDGVEARVAVERA